MFHGHLDYFQKPPLGGRSYTKLGDQGISNAHNCWFVLFYHVWGPTWIEIHWNSIWLRVWSHMTSHYTWRSVTTLHDFGGILGWPLDNFFWALTISWSRLLALMWSGPWSCGICITRASLGQLLTWDLRARDHCTSSTPRWWKWPNYAWGTNGVCEWKMDAKST